MINLPWHFCTNIYHSKCLLFKKSNMRYVDGVAKPILWVDIDDVIFHLWPDLVKYYNLEYGEHKTLKDVWDIGSDQSYHIIEKYNLYKNMMPTSILPVLKQKRKDIYLIMVTSRKDIYVDETMSELYAHWLDFDDIFMWEQKSNVCRSENINHFFDDALHNVIDVHKNAPNTKSYLVKRDWNNSEKLNTFRGKSIKLPAGIITLSEEELCKVLKDIC